MEIARCGGLGSDRHHYFVKYIIIISIKYRTTSTKVKKYDQKKKLKKKTFEAPMTTRETQSCTAESPPTERLKKRDALDLIDYYSLRSDLLAGVCRK